VENQRPYHPRLVCRGTQAVAAVLALLVPASIVCAASPGHPGRGHETVEFDQRSEFSHILVKRQGNNRSLVFVRDNGDEAEESLINIKKPYEILIPYARYMFTSYLFRPEQKRVVIVGLGGGGMVHFLKHYDPELNVEAVEIDPVVVDVADRFFDVRTGGNVRIVTDDGLKYLQSAEGRYDVIYMDAFLKPARDTDPSGIPLHLKTEQFYKDLQQKLEPGGLVVINFNYNKTTDADLATIRRVYAQLYEFRMSTGNLVAVASTSSTRETPGSLGPRAREIDRRFNASFSFHDLIGRMSR
jgi:spermidine synthase